MEKGIEKIKEAIVVLTDVVSAVDKSMADGKFNLTDLVNFWKPSIGVVSLVRNFTDIKEEFFDLDDNEVRELQAWFVENFDIENDEAERHIEVIMSLLIVWSETTNDLYKEIKEVLSFI